jgi:hypothetical protein
VTESIEKKQAKLDPPGMFPSETTGRGVVPHTGNLNTVTVISSRPLIHPEGRYAIELTTREVGPIAFEVDLRAIQILRKDLASIEASMNLLPGTA